MRPVYSLHLSFGFVSGNAIHFLVSRHFRDIGIYIGAWIEGRKVRGGCVLKPIQLSKICKVFCTYFAHAVTYIEPTQFKLDSRPPMLRFTFAPSEVTLPL